MSISFTITTRIFVRAPIHVRVENRSYYRTIDVDTTHNFEAGGLNPILIERSSIATISITSGGATHTAFNSLVIAFNLGNTITTDLSSIITHCLVNAYSPYPYL
jgi:hypothetical protein